MESTIRRRSFLAGALAVPGAVGADAIGSEPQGNQATEPGIGRVRFGIVGIGMQGSGLLQNAISLPGVECVAAADLWDERHTLAREITGNPTLFTTRRYEELLHREDVDCIVAAVPDHWHRRVVVDACAAGKDIYCEKPMSHTIPDGFEMVEAAQKHGRIVQIGSQRVSSSLCAKAHELYKSGTIGEIEMVELTYGRNSPNGAWQYPLPPNLSTSNLDWDRWLNDAPKIPLSPERFVRWRCWKEYGTGVGGDLMVHLLSGCCSRLVGTKHHVRLPPWAASSGGKMGEICRISTPSSSTTTECLSMCGSISDQQRGKLRDSWDRRV